MKYNSEVVLSIISAMRFTENNLVPDYRSISTLTHNGRSFATWDKRFQIVSDKLGNNPRYEIIVIHRGNLWSLVAILDKKDFDLYIMVTDKNLEIRQHEVEINNYSSHYIFSLLLANSGIGTKTEQLGLFPELSKKQKDHRKKDYEKMLGEWADKINKVYIGSFKYDHGDIIGGSLNLFNDMYQLVDTIDLSNQIIHPIENNDPDTKPNNSVLPQEPIHIKLREQTRTQELKTKNKKSKTDKK